MNNDLYRNALSAFNRGEYETAYNIISCSEESLSSECGCLLNECEKLIAEQYYYIIKEYLQQGDYSAARREKEKYAETYGYNPKIESIEIPVKSTFSPLMEDSNEVNNGNKERKSALKNAGLIIGIIAVLLVIIVVWQYIKDEDVMPIQEKMNTAAGVTRQQIIQSTSDIYEQRSNAIIQELTSKYGDRIQVEHKYPELSKYCTFRLKGEGDYGFSYLLIYDLDKEELKQFDTQKLQTINAGEVFLCDYGLSINKTNNNIFIFGSNGANGIGYTKYLLELDSSAWKIRNFCNGYEIEENRDGYIAKRSIMTKWIDCNATSEYALVNIHYNLHGDLVLPSFEGDTYQLKGFIDNQYTVTMQLSIRGNEIYGKYSYGKSIGSKYLFLYGGISKSNDVVLLEFTNSGRETDFIFKGRFTNNSFYGTFTNYHKKNELPFELNLNEGTSNTNSSRPVSKDFNQTDNSEEENLSISDKDPEFPGGMSNLRKYISENIKYPTISQQNGITGKVKVSYIINEDGSISDVEVIESVEPYLDKEAIRVVSSMPKWSPGIRNGKYVKMKTSIYVKFDL